MFNASLFTANNAFKHFIQICFNWHISFGGFDPSFQVRGLKITWKCLWNKSINHLNNETRNLKNLFDYFDELQIAR